MDWGHANPPRCAKNEAWVDRTGVERKALLKPGDAIPSITPNSKPCETEYLRTLFTSVDRNSRLFVAHRFWTEREERSRHIISINRGAELPRFSVSLQRGDSFSYSYCISIYACSSVKSMEVISVEMQHRRSKYLGAFRFSPISSMWQLRSAGPHFIYMFLFFWDGFQITTGKHLRETDCTCSVFIFRLICESLSTLSAFCFNHRHGLAFLIWLCS